MRRPFFIGLGALSALTALTLARAVQSGPTLEDLRPVISQAVSWIEQQRQAHRPNGRPLSEAELLTFGPFFPKEVLEQARVVMTPRFTNPSFVEDIGSRDDGRLLFDMRYASGIALIDTILAVESKTRPGTPEWTELLFHELVHLTQYRALGPEGFIESYIASMVAEEFTYLDISHEAQAYSLQRRFERSPQEIFSVEEEVRQQFRLSP